MLVVADSTPINTLVRLNCADVLRVLFSRVLIPPQVRDELSSERTPQSVRDFVRSLPEWVTVQSAQHVRAMPPLDPGEEAAICLAEETRADALLIDEKDGRREARRRGLRIIGTLGVLELAAERRLILLSAVVERLNTTDFRIDPTLLEAAIARDAQRRLKP